MPARRSYHVLTGPTAAGKTDYLLRRAEHIPLVVISADSRQVYRGMDIGTGKATPEEREKVTHFGLDLQSPFEKLSVFRYLQLTFEWLSELESYSGETWLCGGTGLYIRAVVEGLPLGSAPLPELRPFLEACIEKLGPRQVATELDLRLQDSANPRRVLRAMEAVFADAHGRRMLRALLTAKLDPSAAKAAVAVLDGLGSTEWPHSAGGPTPCQSGWECTGIHVLDPGKEELAERISRRVRGMFAGGLLDECRELHRRGMAGAEVVREGIGYREALAVLEGELRLAEAIERTIVRTRQYAKRQRTYFKGQGWTAGIEPGRP